MTIGLRRLLQWGIPISAAGLLLPAPPPGDGLLAYSLIHLLVLQLATFLYAMEIAPRSDSPWFSSTRRPWLASVASLVASVVGFSALLTLASSAAARYQPSLQFLQLLSSMDIAWVVAASYLGSRLMWGRTAARVVGSILLLACVGSIAIYLDVVGFDARGGWIVDGARLMRIVITADTVAAVLALSLVLSASGRGPQRTVQASPQSYS